MKMGIRIRKEDMLMFSEFNVGIMLYPFWRRSSFEVRARIIEMLWPFKRTQRGRKGKILDQTFYRKVFFFRGILTLRRQKDEFFSHPSWFEGHDQAALFRKFQVRIKASINGFYGLLDSWPNTKLDPKIIAEDAPTA
ncbi:uncharacterized protein LOC129755317 [Uranotaenia lowii]|uniref:uncharacterized protein LOC129755317 n=1 Tax=Uranotaenia lowii TaxID=190385 RepID=UPI0024797C19|nr:uncharacterized protein LOC129755317 [Uranotaenia lowii]